MIPLQPMMYSYLYRALYAYIKRMSFVDVDGTLPDFMYTILVYLLCGLYELWASPTNGFQEVPFLL